MRWLLIAGVAGALLVATLMSYQEGYKNGAAKARNAALEQSNDVLLAARKRHAEELKTAAEQALRLRNEAAQREAVYEQTTVSLQQQITQLRAQYKCLDWRLPAELMQPIANARAAAARAATGAAHAAVPSAASAAAQRSGE